MKASSFQSNWGKIGFVKGNGNSNSPKEEYKLSSKNIL